MKQLLSHCAFITFDDGKREFMPEVILTEEEQCVCAPGVNTRQCGNSWKPHTHTHTHSQQVSYLVPRAIMDLTFVM